MSHQRWIKVLIVLAILGICIKIDNLSTGKRGKYIYLSQWHTLDFGYLSCLIVTGWSRWCFWLKWCQFWSRLTDSLWWRYTDAVASPVSVKIVCGAIVAREVAIRLNIRNHSRASFHRCFHKLITRRLNLPLHLLSDLALCILELELRFLVCVTAWQHVTYPGPGIPGFI